MHNRHCQPGDRRKDENTRAMPFRDGSGTVIREDRRKLPDRRLNNIQAEWVNEILLGS